MNREDARYTISEIAWMEYYGKKADELKKKIDEIQSQIDTATDPKSPQGYENIGAGRNMSFAGKESYLNIKITQKDKLQKELNKVYERYIDAQICYFLILDQTEEKDFTRDYFGRKMTKQQLEEKYHITKAYRKMVQIVMEAI